MAVSKKISENGQIHIFSRKIEKTAKFYLSSLYWRNVSVQIKALLNDVLQFIKMEIQNGNQIFWVCPLIDESKKLDHTSAIKKYEFLKKKFPHNVALLHGKTDTADKEKILKEWADGSVLLWSEAKTKRRCQRRTMDNRITALKNNGYIP